MAIIQNKGGRPNKVQMLLLEERKKLALKLLKKYNKTDVAFIFNLHASYISNIIAKELNIKLN
jgi:hypothetical protein